MFVPTRCCCAYGKGTTNRNITTKWQTLPPNTNRCHSLRLSATVSPPSRGPYSLPVDLVRGIAEGIFTSGSYGLPVDLIARVSQRVFGRRAYRCIL